MPDREGPARAVYDHTEDEPRPAGRRRRQVADWGVGEELFDGMPGRRFERRAEHRIPRGGADDGRRTIVIAEAETAEPEIGEEEFASREEALRAREEHDAVWAGDEPFAAADESLATEEEAPADLDAPGHEPLGPDEIVGERMGPDGIVRERMRPDGIVRDRLGPDGIVRGGVEGRRTVKIGGRPPEFHSAPVRRRAVHERVGPRPDRIAAWAFALGLLLILIAIVT
jgi:hypothetical protein